MMPVRYGRFPLSRNLVLLEISHPVSFFTGKMKRQRTPNIDPNSNDASKGLTISKQRTKPQLSSLPPLIKAAPPMRRETSLVGKAEGFDVFDPAILGPRSKSIPEIEAPAMFRDKSITEYNYASAQQEEADVPLHLHGDGNLLPTISDFRGNPEFPGEDEQAGMGDSDAKDNGNLRNKTEGIEQASAAALREAQPSGACYPTTPRSSAGNLAIKSNGVGGEFWSTSRRVFKGEKDQKSRGGAATVSNRGGGGGRKHTKRKGSIDATSSSSVNGGMSNGKKSFQRRHGSGSMANEAASDSKISTSTNNGYHHRGSMDGKQQQTRGMKRHSSSSSSSTSPGGSNKMRRGDTGRRKVGGDMASPHSDLLSSPTFNNDGGGGGKKAANGVLRRSRRSSMGKPRKRYVEVESDQEHDNEDYEGGEDIIPGAPAAVPGGSTAGAEALRALEAMGIPIVSVGESSGGTAPQRSRSKSGGNAAKNKR
eukprot:jgi/Bigna1/134657/aug1.26_g9365